MSISLRELVMGTVKIADVRAKNCSVDLLVGGRWKHYTTEDSVASAELKANNIRRNFCSRT